VRDIYFAYPSLAAVQVAKSAGLEVTDCVVYDVEWDLTGLPTPPKSRSRHRSFGRPAAQPRAFRGLPGARQRDPPGGAHVAADRAAMRSRLLLDLAFSPD
jgi:hypothetical protein